MVGLRTYQHPLVLSARIIIVTLWIEFLCLVADIVFYGLILYPVGLLYL